MDASQLLLEWRERRGLTQRQLAEMADVTYAMIHHYEQNGSRPRRPVAEKIDQALDAGGTLLRAWGYLIDNPDELEQLKERVTLLEERTLTLAKQMERLLRQAKK
jgi:transcriptional regulator with XRE-family HTH domain